MKIKFLIFLMVSTITSFNTSEVIEGKNIDNLYIELVSGLDSINEEFQATGTINMELMKENDLLHRKILESTSVAVFQSKLKETIESQNPKCSGQYRICVNLAYSKFYATPCSSDLCKIQKINKLQVDLDTCERRFCSGDPRDDNDGDGEMDGPIPF